MSRRRKAGNDIFKQRFETGARFDARIPVFGGAVVIPRHVTDIVDGRQVCRRRDVGQRNVVARQPAAAFGQKADVVKVIVNIGEVITRLLMMPTLFFLKNMNR